MSIQLYVYPLCEITGDDRCLGQLMHLRSRFAASGSSGVGREDQKDPATIRRSLLGVALAGIFIALAGAAFGQSGGTITAGTPIQSWNSYLVILPTSSLPYRGFVIPSANTAPIFGTPSTHTAPADVSATLATLPEPPIGAASFDPAKVLVGGGVTDVAGNIYRPLTNPSFAYPWGAVSKTSPSGTIRYISVPFQPMFLIGTQTAIYIVAGGFYYPIPVVFRLNVDGSQTKVADTSNEFASTSLPVFASVDSNDNISFAGYLKYSAFGIALGGTFNVSQVYAAVGPVPYIQPGLASVTSLPLAQNQTLSLSVNAVSTLPISYQWSYNGAAVTGANQATYSGPFLGAGNYSVVANTGGGTVSSNTQVQLTVAGVAVTAAPTFLSNPISATGILGTPTTLTATAASTSSLTFQWYLNGTVIPGATAGTPATTYGAYETNFSANQPGLYTVVATSATTGALTASSGATVKIQSTNGIPVFPTPTILVQPNSLNALYANGTVTAAGLSVTAIATLPISYQWLLDGSVIVGATSSSFNAASPGTYTVAVSTSAGTSTSQTANVAVVTSTGIVVTAAPTITAQPQSAGLLFGSGQGLPLLSVSAVALQNMVFQWYLDGTPISGATASTYQTTKAGAFTVVVATSAGSVTSSPALVTLANRLANISARPQVGTGAAVAISGFVVSSYTAASKQVLIRGVGPSLSQFGLSGLLSQPVVSVFDSTGRLIASNAGWNNSADIAAAGVATGAFPLTAGSADAALLLDLAPGAYTAQVSGANGTTGLALAEVYETNADAGRLANISNRAFVGAGSSILIGGWVAAGSQSSKVLIRAVGPALAQFGLSNNLSQPILTVYDANRKLIAVNIGWSSGGSAEAVSLNNAALSVGAFPLQPGSNDCAVLMTLAPGAYTAQVSGASGTTGIALVEIYQVP
jgi:hypothetical protein